MKYLLIGLLFISCAKTKECCIDTSVAFNDTPEFNTEFTVCDDLKGDKHFFEQFVEDGTSTDSGQGYTTTHVAVCK